MSLSFVGYCHFVGTGDISDIGTGEGRFYALNVPLDEGITDDLFSDLFKTIITRESSACARVLVVDLQV